MVDGREGDVAGYASAKIIQIGWVVLALAPRASKKMDGCLQPYSVSRSQILFTFAIYSLHLFPVCLHGML
jgi:hypothetical protein